jgi:hypothetical protein
MIMTSPTGPDQNPLAVMHDVSCALQHAIEEISQSRMEHLQISRRGVPKRQNEVIWVDIFTFGERGTGSITCAQSQPLARPVVAVYFVAQWNPSY